MTNTNCLAGMACPKCGFGERLEVVTQQYHTLHKNTDGRVTFYPEFGPHSEMLCPSCSYEGIVDDFYTSNQPGPTYDIWIAEPDDWTWASCGTTFTCDDDPDGKGARHFAHEHARYLRDTYPCAFVAVRQADKGLPLPIRLAALSTLPPDPDGMNANRAEWAAEALSRFQEVVNTDEDMALPDLLADLRHWCDRQGIEFDGANEHGRQHYLAEIGDPSSEFYP
jgi:hypothetical protein